MSEAHDPRVASSDRGDLLQRALRIFSLVLLALGVGLTVAAFRLDQNAVLWVLALAGVLATYRVSLAVRPGSKTAAQVGFWMTLPLLTALVAIAPPFAVYTLVGFVEAWTLFRGTVEWLAEALTAAVCVLAIMGGVVGVLGSWALAGTLFVGILLAVRIARRVADAPGRRQRWIDPGTGGGTGKSR